MRTALFAALGISSASIGEAQIISEYVVPAGPVISLEDGRKIDGHIVRIDQENIVLVDRDGVEETVPRATVLEVRFVTIAGSEVVGQLADWQPGIYELATSDAQVKVFSAEPVQAGPSNRIASPATDAAPGKDDKAEAEIAVDRLARTVGQPAEPEAVPRTSLPAADTPPAADGTNMAQSEPTPEQDKAKDAAPAPSPTATADRLEIAVSVSPAREGGPPIAFDIELSSPATGSVVLIYATIDGTARGGSDYEPQRGVMIIKPGEQSARLEVPLIDDDEVEAEEELQLFVTVDPSIAVVTTQQIVATIEDDDG